VAVAAGRRRGGADRDVRPGGGVRVAGEKDDAWKPERAENEPDRRAEIARREREREG